MLNLINDDIIEVLNEGNIIDSVEQTLAIYRDENKRISATPTAQDFYNQHISALRSLPIGKEILYQLESSNYRFYVFVTDYSPSQYIHHERMLRAINQDIGLIVICSAYPTEYGGGISESNFTVDLAHEAGHALQWLNYRLWFTSKVNAAINNADYESVYAFETHNMVQHEWPVCDELGVPRRKGYPGPKDVIALPNVYSDRWPKIGDVITGNIINNMGML